MLNESRINFYLNPRLWHWYTMSGLDNIIKFRGPFVSARWRSPIVDVRAVPTPNGHHIEWDREGHHPDVRHPFSESRVEITIEYPE